MATTFARALSPPALAVATSVAPSLQRLAAEGASIHLRPGNVLTAYYRGRAALRLELGTAMPRLGVAGGAPAVVELPALSGVIERAWRRAVELVDRGRRVPERESAQAFFATALDGLLLVDIEVRLPAGALGIPALAEVTADALLVAPASGDGWLVEVKLALSPELDHDVLDQLGRTAALPGALHGGVPAFLDAYAAVLRQRQQLGLLRPSRDLRTVTAALLVLGAAPEAHARIGCWEGPLPPALGAVVAPGGRLSPTSFEPLPQLLDRARQGPRAPHAPRRSRWNAFTAAEDERLGGQAGLGEHEAAILAYAEAHDAPFHHEVHHPRSSQAACLELFAPVRFGGAGAALVQFLEPFFAPVGFVPEAVTDCDFEVPHVAPCRDKSCAVRADMGALAGEGGSKTTRLDAFLRVVGRHEGQRCEAVVGVEYKYSEPEFGTCGGFVSAGNTEDDRARCISGHDRRARCYLLRVHRRRYLADTSSFTADPLSAPGPCLLLGGANQLYRSHFVTRALATSLGARHALFLVVADARNPSLFLDERPIPGFVSAGSAFDAYRRALRPEVALTVTRTTPQAVAAALGLPEATRRRRGWDA